MKRVPLVRRSPLVGQRGIARTARVRPVSDKRKAENALRAPVRAAMLTASPWCQARWRCAGDPATDLHERLSRARGGSTVDMVQAHGMVCCRACHSWLTEHPADAEARRLLLPSWHVCPAVGPC